jgi:hypothetical protein
VKPKFLSLSDILELIRNSDKHIVLPICTVMEPIEIVEKVKKARISLDLTVFEQRWIQLCRQLNIVFLELDVECLQRSLFQDTEGFLKNDLWTSATDVTVSPSQTIRRLILRPSEQTWWDEEIYNEVEQWYAEFRDG